MRLVEQVKGTIPVILFEAKKLNGLGRKQQYGASALDCTSLRPWIQGCLDLSGQKSRFQTSHRAIPADHLQGLLFLDEGNQKCLLKLLDKGTLVSFAVGRSIEDNRLLYGFESINSEGETTILILCIEILRSLGATEVPPTKHPVSKTRAALETGTRFPRPLNPQANPGVPAQ